MNTDHGIANIRKMPWKWTTALAAAWIGGVGLGILGGHPLALILILGAAIGTMVARYRKPSVVAGHVRTNESHLILGETKIPWSQISRVDTKADDQPTAVVRGSLGHAMHELRFPTIDACRAFARSLRLQGISGSTITNGFARWVRVPVTTVLIGGLLALRFGADRILRGPFTPSLAIPLLLGLSIALLACLLGRTSIELGQDGIRINEWQRRRFIPFDQIAEVGAVSDALRIVTTRGEAIRFAAASATTWKGAGERAIELEQSIRRAMTRFRETHSPQALTLSAPSEHAGEWKARVKAHDERYRTSSETPDQLSALLEHPAALPTARVAAAVKLAKEGGEEAKAKIRIAAAETASPRLRVALEKAANGDMDAALDEAIEAERAT